MLKDDPILTRRRLLRQRALAAREALGLEHRIRLEQRVAHHVGELLMRLTPRTIAFCWPYRAEPDLRETVAAWLAGDEARRAALPVVVERAAPLLFRRWQPGAPLEADRHGILQPTAACEELHPELVLVPLNAFDARGYRLGYGGGYFDRTLALRSVTAVGVGFEIGRVDHALPQAHDRPMNWLVTEAGVFECLQA